MTQIVPFAPTFFCASARICGTCGSERRANAWGRECPETRVVDTRKFMKRKNETGKMENMTCMVLHSTLFLVEFLSLGILWRFPQIDASLNGRPPMAYDHIPFVRVICWSFYCSTTSNTLQFQIVFSDLFSDLFLFLDDKQKTWFCERHVWLISNLQKLLVILDVQSKPLKRCLGMISSKLGTRMIWSHPPLRSGDSGLYWRSKRQKGKQVLRPRSESGHEPEFLVNCFLFMCLFIWEFAISCLLIHLFISLYMNSES